MALTHTANNIVTDGLSLFLDAANYKSWTANNKNLIVTNPTPTSAADHFASGGTGEVVYDSINQAVLWTRDTYASWGGYLYNNTFFYGSLDTTKQYTASFEWYSQSDSGIGYTWQLVRGDSQNGAAQADVMGNSTSIGNGWYRFSYTFTPTNSGDVANFRVILAILNFGGTQERRKTYFMWRKLQLEQNSSRTDFVDGTQPTVWNDLSKNKYSIANSSSRTYAPFNSGCVWFRGDAPVNGFVIPSSVIDLEQLGQTRNFTVMYGVRKKYYGYSGNNNGNGVILTASGSGYGQGWRITENNQGTLGSAFTGNYSVGLSIGNVGEGLSIQDPVANRPAIGAFSVSPTLIYAFLNGTSDSKITPTYIAGSHTGQIGTSNYGVGAFAGDFYFIMIYNRALSANEILQNYNALKGRYGL